MADERATSIFSVLPSFFFLCFFFFLSINDVELTFQMSEQQAQGLILSARKKLSSGGGLFGFLSDPSAKYEQVLMMMMLLFLCMMCVMMMMMCMLFCVCALSSGGGLFGFLSDPSAKYEQVVMMMMMMMMLLFMLLLCVMCVAIRWWSVWFSV